MDKNGKKIKEIERREQIEEIIIPIRMDPHDE
jgi:hypothetical protein